MKWMITVPKKTAEMIYSGKQQVYICNEMNILVYKNDIFFMCEKDSGGKVVGMFIIKDLLCNSPDVFWNKFGNLPGWTKEEFVKYSEGQKIIQGLRISQAVAADKPFTLSDFGLSQPPSGMVYIT